MIYTSAIIATLLGCASAGVSATSSNSSASHEPAAPEADPARQSAAPESSKSVIQDQIGDSDKEAELPYRTVVVHERADDARSRRADASRKTPGFSSAVDIEEDRSSHPGRLPEIVNRTPSATTRSIGGLGQFSALSLRGSSTQQVRVFLDGVPIDGSFSGLANLSQSSLGELSYAEIFRGYMPIDYGGATMGGALAMYSRTHKHGAPLELAAHTGYGSFGARSAGLNLGLPLGKRRTLFTLLDYHGADGDYPFLDTQGTPFNVQDDLQTIRSNNGYDRGNLFLSLSRAKSSDRSWAGQSFARLLLDDLQIPGLGRAQSTQARQKLWNVRLHTRQWRSFEAPGSKLSLVGSIAREKRRYLDPKGEVGLGRDHEIADTVDAYLSALLRWPLWSTALLGVGLDQRFEAVLVDVLREMPENAVFPSPGDATRFRLSSGASVQLEQYLWQDKILVQPALRVDFARSLFDIPDTATTLTDEGKDHSQWGLSPRLGAKVLTLPALEFRGSVGRYFRLPTLMELFGDRGYIVGNEGLVAERGLSTDLGFRWFFDTLQNDLLSVEVSSAFFSSWPRELIMWQRAGPRVRAVNLRAATIRGVESELHLEGWKSRVRFDSNYTWIQSKNKSPEPTQIDRPLPGRPKHQFFAKLSGGRPTRPAELRKLGFDVFLNYEWISGNFLDPSGRYEIPPRSIWGTGASLSYFGFHLGFSVRNLFDKREAMIEAGGLQGPKREYPAPIADYLGYPLPGRSFWVSLRFSHQLRRKARTHAQDK